MAIGKYKMLYEKSVLEMQRLIEKVNDITVNPHLELGKTARMYGEMLCAKDRAQCSNRYVWKNLPINLTSQELETFFYNYGSLCFFMKDGRLIISKYATGGTLNPMGMLAKIKPIDFAGHSYGMELNVLQPNGDAAQGNDVAVIINDYTGSYQIKNEISRSIINSGSTIKDQCTVYQQLINNIIVSGKKAVAICDNDDQATAVRAQANQFLMSGRPVEALSNIDKQKGLPIEMFNFSNNFDCGNYQTQLDYYDKVRANFNGIPTTPTAEKREHLINAEVDNANSISDIMLYDGLKCRRDGLEMLKKYYSVYPEIQAIEVDIADCLKPVSVKQEQGEEYNDTGDDENE